MHLGLCTTYCDDQRGLWMIRGPSYRAFRIQTHNRRNYPAPVFVSSQGDPMNAFQSHLCSRVRFDSTDRLGAILKPGSASTVRSTITSLFYCSCSSASLLLLLFEKCLFRLNRIRLLIFMYLSLKNWPLIVRSPLG